MIFTETKLKGVFLIEADCHVDERGYFTSFFAEEEFETHGLETRFVQHAVSHNARKATLRGLHHQAAPHEQAKLVWCTRGSVFDVVVDVRPTAETYLAWFAVELDARSQRSIYIPRGMAHGFLSLQNETQVSYLISARRVPEAERGVRWDDPVIGVAWPIDPVVVSARDLGFPLLRGKRAARG